MAKENPVRARVGGGQDKARVEKAESVHQGLAARVVPQRLERIHLRQDLYGPVGEGRGEGAEGAQLPGMEGFRNRRRPLAEHARPPLEGVDALPDPVGPVGGQLSPLLEGNGGPGRLGEGVGVPSCGQVAAAEVGLLEGGGEEIDADRQDQDRAPSAAPGGRGNPLEEQVGSEARRQGQEEGEEEQVARCVEGVDQGQRADRRQTVGGDHQQAEDQADPAGGETAVPPAQQDHPPGQGQGAQGDPQVTAVPVIRVRGDQPEAHVRPAQQVLPGGVGDARQVHGEVVHPRVARARSRGPRSGRTRRRCRGRRAGAPAPKDRPTRRNGRGRTTGAPGRSSRPGSWRRRRTRGG